MLRSAVEYASCHWPVYPLHGKVPAIPSAHRTREVFGSCIEIRLVTRDPLRGKCKGGCGQLGHGHYDASTDRDVVTQWWSKDYPGADIGVAFPPTVMDVEYTTPVMVVTRCGRTCSPSIQRSRGPMACR
jgi:hypothetical protein